METALSQALTLYNGPFFSSGQKELLMRAIKEGHADETVNKAGVWFSDNVNQEDVIDHLSHRVPIYYGEPMTCGIPSYDDQRLKALCGYSTEEAMVTLSKYPSIVYCVGGPVYDLLNPQKKDAILHAWGVNLETTRTSHYGIFVHQGILDENAYKSYCEQTLMCIYTAVKALEYKRLHLPFLGLGQYLRSINREQQRVAKRGFFDALRNVSKKFPDIYTEVRGLQNDIELITNILDIETYFDSNVRIVCANLVETGPEPTVVVNPSDSCSFFGNGGCDDPTLDGFIVSGQRLGWRTTAYLHNNMISRLSTRPDALIPVCCCLRPPLPMPPPLVRSVTARDHQ